MTCPVCASIRVREVRIPTGRPLVRCAECLLLFAASATAAVDVSRACLSDDERRLEERVAQRRTPHFTRLLRGAGSPGRLLDVGTGVGELLKLAREAGWQAVGVDIDPAVVAHARGRGLDVRYGELADLGLAAASFDLITLWNVIDFVPEPLALLRECRRLLAPGGRIFVRTPNVPFQREGARLARGLAAVGLGRFVDNRPRWLGIFNASNFSAATLRIVLERAGFRDIRVGNSRPVGGDPYFGLGRVGEIVLDVGKRAVFGAVQATALASGGRSLLGPSIEGWGRNPT
jgi:SAM-dependent methyltransferase